jgi:hypothetical protein
MRASVSATMTASVMALFSGLQNNDLVLNIAYWKNAVR